MAIDAPSAAVPPASNTEPEAAKASKVCLLCYVLPFIKPLAAKAQGEGGAKDKEGVYKYCQGEGCSRRCTCT
jgi:hypothetical protein